MSYANGQLPSTALASISGGKLRKDAAAAWKAMDAESVRRGWGHLQVVDSYRVLGHPGDYSRGVWSQWAAWERYQHGGNLAARPGTSNHGLGITVDVTRHTRWVIDQIGAKYGWSKRWSDAPSEWWHIKWEAGHWHGKPSVPTLRLKQRGPTIKKLQKRLRALGFKSVPVRGNKYGYFGASTRDAVMRVQRKHGLKPDGIVGPKTWALIERLVK